MSASNQVSTKWKAKLGCEKQNSITGLQVGKIWKIMQQRVLVSYIWC